MFFGSGGRTARVVRLLVLGKGARGQHDVLLVGQCFSEILPSEMFVAFFVARFFLFFVALAVCWKEWNKEGIEDGGRRLSPVGLLNARPDVHCHGRAARKSRRSGSGSGG